MPRVWRSPNSATWVPLPSPTHSHEWLEADMGRPLLSPSQGRPTNPKVAVIGAGMKLRSPEADLDANYKQVRLVWRMSVHVSSKEWSEYYRQYAKHFNLYEHIVFDTTIEVIKRDEIKSKWMVHIKGEIEPQVFDRVVFSSGSETVAMHPKIDDVHKFEGQFLHGQAYKSPADFKDKNIIVLGMGNSACDTACELTEYAAKVYLAHRRGAKILPRANEDGPLDSYVSWKISRMALWTEHHAPGIFQILADGLLQKNSDSHFNGEEAEQNVEWGLEETSGDVTTIICNDHLKRLVHEKRIASVKGVKRIIGPRTVELDNGDIIDDVDAIIACTGYRADFSLLPDLPSTQLDASLPAFPDLYQMIFPPHYADSLACTNYCIINESAAAYRELQAMAIAQVWAGHSVLPSEEAMTVQVNEYQTWLARQMLTFPATMLGKGQMYPWMRWLHDTAGTGLYEYMGWSLKGMWFWLRNRERGQGEGISKEEGKDLDLVSEVGPTMQCPSSFIWTWNKIHRFTLTLALLWLTRFREVRTGCTAILRQAEFPVVSEPFFRRSPATPLTRDLIPRFRTYHSFPRYHVFVNSSNSRALNNGFFQRISCRVPPAATGRRGSRPLGCRAQRCS
ncbi:Monooxygenase aurF like protein [Verticillium longisporum]|nr:Monooxygenase aurF like protein [Verticillium longisporum]